VNDKRREAFREKLRGIKGYEPGGRREKPRPPPETEGRYWIERDRSKEGKGKVTTENQNLQIKEREIAYQP